MPSPFYGVATRYLMNWGLGILPQDIGSYCPPVPPFFPFLAKHIDPRQEPFSYLWQPFMSLHSYIQSGNEALSGELFTDSFKCKFPFPDIAHEVCFTQPIQKAVGNVLFATAYGNSWCYWSANFSEKLVREMHTKLFLMPFQISMNLSGIFLLPLGAAALVDKGMEIVRLNIQNIMATVFCGNHTPR